MPIVSTARRAVVLAFGLAACAEPTVVQTDRVFILVGTQGAARWNSPDVPGSLKTRPGTTLPAFLVCETENAQVPTWAAAVVDRGTLRLHDDGTSRLELTAGTWWKTHATNGGSGGPISEYGRWTELTRGTIHLSGFTTIAFDAPLQYTELGNGLTSMTFECPGVSSATTLTSELIFRLAP